MSVLLSVQSQMLPVPELHQSPWLFAGKAPPEMPQVRNGFENPSQSKAERAAGKAEVPAPLSEAFRGSFEAIFPMKDEAAERPVLRTAFESVPVAPYALDPSLPALEQVGVGQTRV